MEGARQRRHSGERAIFRTRSLQAKGICVNASVNYSLAIRLSVLPNNLLKILEYESSKANTIDDGRELIHEDQVGGFEGDIRTGHNGDTDVAGTKSGGVVNTVTSYSNYVLTALELVDNT